MSAHLPHYQASACSALLALFVSLPAHTTQPPRLNAWDELRPDSEAYAVLKQRCQAEAREEFFAIRENVKGIFLESEDRALSYIVASSTSYGINYAYPPSSYLRVGLSFVEYDSSFAAIRRFEAPPKTDAGAVRHFDTKTRLTQSVAKRSTNIRISYKRTTSDSEESVGVYGRLIEVTDDATSTVLARRRDFVWLNPDRKGAHGGYMCPTLKEAENFPFTFLNKVLNVSSYTCWTTFENGLRAMANKYDTRARDILMASMQACEASYFR